MSFDRRRNNALQKSQSEVRLLKQRSMNQSEKDKQTLAVQGVKAPISRQDDSSLAQVGNKDNPNAENESSLMSSINRPLLQNELRSS